MKKIIYVLIIMTTLPTYAATMCAANDTIAIILDPSINATSSKIDNTTSNWSLSFPYGTIHGSIACIDTNHNKARGSAIPDLTDSYSNPIVGGERNGSYCWCKLVHPVKSTWIFVQKYDSNCTLSCLTDYLGCVSSISRGSDNSLRSKIFSTITN